jgi:hypothetical protein
VYPLCPLARCACLPRSLALLERPLFTRGDPFANKSVQSGQAVALVTNWQQLDYTLTTRARGFQENVSFDHCFGTYPHASNSDCSGASAREAQARGRSRPGPRLDRVAGLALRER